MLWSDLHLLWYLGMVTWFLGNVLWNLINSGNLIMTYFWKLSIQKIDVTLGNIGHTGKYIWKWLEAFMKHLMPKNNCNCSFHILLILLPGIFGTLWTKRLQYRCFVQATVPLQPVFALFVAMASGIVVVPTTEFD